MDVNKHNKERQIIRQLLCGKSGEVENCYLCEKWTTCKYKEIADKLHTFGYQNPDSVVEKNTARNILSELKYLVDDGDYSIKEISQRINELIAIYHL